MLQEVSKGALWNVLRGRFAALQDEHAGFWVRRLARVRRRGPIAV